MRILLGENGTLNKKKKKKKFIVRIREGGYLHCKGGSKTAMAGSFSGPMKVNFARGRSPERWWTPRCKLNIDRLDRSIQILKFQLSASKSGFDLFIEYINHSILSFAVLVLNRNIYIYINYDLWKLSMRKPKCRFIQELTLEAEISDRKDRARGWIFFGISSLFSVWSLLFI